MIQVTHLTKMYGPRTAIQDLNFEIQSGEVVGFLGPNGAGKSTTMKILTGFMPATEGKATVAGYDVFEKPIEVKRNVGYLPETPPVYTEMRVLDYLRFAAKLHGVPKGRIEFSVSKAVEKTGLGEVRGRLIGNLSKGFRQRVGLAQALVHNPKVLILDEPTVGLDPKQIIEIRELIQGLAGDHTVILSSHILPEVTATCQRVIVINRGKIVAIDSIDDLTQRITGKGAPLVLVARDTSDSAVSAIRGVNGVEAVQVAGNQLRIRTAGVTPDLQERILEAAVSKRLGVREFYVEKASLEEVFLELTTEEDAEGKSV